MIDKNKEEIGKIDKEIEKLKPCVDFYGQTPTLTKDNTEEFIKYCELKKARQERIKTSIQWCEDEIEFLKDKFIILNTSENDELDAGIVRDEIEERLQQLQNHLTYQKEQEAEL